MKLYHATGLFFKVRWLIAFAAVWTVSPDNTSAKAGTNQPSSNNGRSSSYCPDASATCPSVRTDNYGNPVRYDNQGRPIERRLDNNGNPLPPTPVRSQQAQPSLSNCRVFLPAPHNTKAYYYRGICPDGLGNGYHKTQVFAANDNQPILVETTLVKGYPTGKLGIATSAGYAMYDELRPDGSMSGMSSRADGAWQLGVFKNGVFMEGLVQKLNQPTEFVVDGRPASEAEYKAKQALAAAVPSTNRSSKSEPPCFMERPFIKQGNRLTGEYPGRCINDRYNGKAVLNLYDQLDKYGDPLIFTVNYKDGKPFGTAMLDSGNGAIIFTGTLKNWVPWYGYTQVFDENNRPKRYGLINSKDVPYAQIGRLPTFTPYEPPVELASSTKPTSKKGGCDAERPTDRYFVAGDYPGTCQNGRYTGVADLTLTPKDASLPTIKVKASFQNGYLSGPVTATYPQLGITYKGTFDGWRPQDGISEQPTGNRNFVVKEYRSGVEIASRSEYRQPSELELALIGAAGQLGEKMGRKLGQEIDGTADRQRRQKREAETYQRQQDIARANDITRSPPVDTYAQQQEAARIERERVIEDARQKQLAGLDRDGNPLPAPATPVQVARSDPQPVFTTDTNPSATPTVTTNPPVFGGNANPQGDPPIITTQTPELPAPHPTAPTLPDPVRGVEPLAPPVPAPVQVAALPAPSTPNPNGPPPLAPPVQLGNGHDTLGSGSAPSNPVPSPQPLDTPATPSQPVVPTTSRPAATPASTGSNSPVSLARPNAPTETYPGYPTEQSAIVFADNTPTFGWSNVTGATYYQVAARNLGTGLLEINETVRSASFTPSRPLAAGQLFRWNVMACNGSGCSAPSGSKYFRTAGATTSPQTGDSLASNAWAAASQGTKNCAITLARETGESLETAFQLVTSAGGWQQLAGGVASGAWNILKHPILSVKAAWNGLTGQVSGVRDAVNAGNPSLACQRAVTLSVGVIGVAEGAQAAKATLANLRRVQTDNVSIPTTSVVNAVVDSKARNHILNGDSTGGGHRFGTGISGKTEFPQSWSDSKIITAVSQIAGNPRAVWSKPGTGTYITSEGYVDGILIRVVYDLEEQRIVNGYPRNTPTNP